MKQKISVVINTYNAGRYLEEVLNSVHDFDEVVICDMESKDRTIEIVREYFDKSHCQCKYKIVTFPKKNYVSAEPARTFAIQSATYPWVLVIDADEVVTPQLKNYLYKFADQHKDALLSRTSATITGLWIPRKSYFMGKFMHAFYPDYLLRFFIKEGTNWPPNVHTFPIVEGRQIKVPRSHKDLALIHLANDSMYDCIRKINEYTQNEVDKKASKNYGVVALLWKPFFRFFKAYFLKKGFLDGKAGLVNALIQSVYQIVAVGKIIERKSQTPS